MSELSQTGADKSTKAESVLVSNMLAAIGVSDTVRTSLGPRGMDKMITGTSKETTITNDGATIMSELQVLHPCAKMFVEMSKAQDVEAGDGTTTVVVMAGSLLQQAHRLVQKGIHPNVISRAFGIAVNQVEPILRQIAVPITLTDKEILIQNCVTSLSSKMVSANSEQLAELAVDAVLSVMEEMPAPPPILASMKAEAESASSSASSSVSTKCFNADLKRVKLIKQLGTPVEECKLIKGLALSASVSHEPKAKTKVEKAKIALIQFCISPPKTDMDSTVVVKQKEEIDAIVRRERSYIVDICKKFKAANVNVVLVQKSILRDALSDMALYFLAKAGIMTVKDIERDDVEFICRATGCVPIASPDEINGVEGGKNDPFGYAELVEEVHPKSSSSMGAVASSYVQFTNIKEKPGHEAGSVVCLLCCAPNKMMLDETERSLHDALCVARSLVKRPYLIPGGGAAETELAVQLGEYARTLSLHGSETDCGTGLDAVGVRAFGEALEMIPLTLAENAGLPPITVLTELRAMHHAAHHSEEGKEIDEETKKGKYFGINIRKNAIGNMMEAKVVQPMLITLSAVQLATETVRQILRIDDICAAR
ncbi:chaperonin containing TCP1, group II (cytosolic) [Monocercomonoides exilis]|uniref:chaperonin containing TCP1, group II (cytosolic) n=1 Tax=Monocercomonoides exilis TaxID=2049356 RepID=UPI003559854A|nr:chaperonin containing TCP1, group II (cytosolic) [Monocercomonoides exilis]|eukprot:MONOS_6397.1-p1 / transcript=MONOS_6397.1 / gene=MONOS_6397 / organism=Monocercomonoides_exilis_PA203 / gene_product=chaperonin containing TCP1, group II (cytosolic) / transcript_product=chaperonin containing TCP1, group II (cytosolic) / location=Mono_scaffold00201:22138-24361(-) / protein_length=597 / sequence_SO=supercontig / SO=protein_coding / is_pseudo=false